MRKFLFLVIGFSLLGSTNFSFAQQRGFFDFIRRPSATRLPGDPNPNKWPYQRPTDTGYEKEYKEEVRNIQNSSWVFGSLKQQRQQLTGELARCRLQLRQLRGN